MRPQIWAIQCGGGPILIHRLYGGSCKRALMQFKGRTPDQIKRVSLFPGTPNKTVFLLVSFKTTKKNTHTHTHYGFLLASFLVSFWFPLKPQAGFPFSTSSKNTHPSRAPSWLPCRMAEELPWRQSTRENHRTASEMAGFRVLFGPVTSWSPVTSLEMQKNRESCTEI